LMMMKKKDKKKKKVKEAFQPLLDWWKKNLGSKVEKVSISNRLTDTPCIVVSSEYGSTANMERIKKAQAFSNADKAADSQYYGRKSLEINTSHPAIKELLKRIKESSSINDETTDVADMLYESALLASGYTISNPNEFSERMDRIVKYSLNLDRHEKAIPLEVILEEEKDPNLIAKQEITIEVPNPPQQTEEKASESTEEKKPEAEHKKDDL